MPTTVAQPPYFELTAPFRVIVGAFALLVVPLMALSLIPNFLEWVPYLIVIESVGLGVTHFFITLALYLQSQNLDYFASSVRNRLIYFVAPATILVGFALIEATRAETRYPVFMLWFFAAVRLADFFHVGRQSYGMLQIWKHPAAGALPRWQRSAENVFFVGLALLQLETYMSGQHFQSGLMAAVIPAIALALLFAVLAAAYLRAADRNLGPKALRPLAYFTMQAACGAAAVYQTRLYVIALVLHYVEYHMIMAPRCFYTPLSQTRRVDRVTGFLRSRTVLFYALLLVIVVLFEARNHVPADLAPGTLFFVHLFDGIFVLHYFVEAFLWRFGNPHYRKALLPLYAKPWNEASEGARRDPSAPALGMRSALALAGVLAVGLGTAHAFGGLARAGTYLKRTVGDSGYAEQQFEFGLALANAGELERARKHLQVSLEHNPGNPRARGMILQIDQFLELKRAERGPAP